MISRTLAPSRRRKAACGHSVRHAPAAMLGGLLLVAGVLNQPVQAQSPTLLAATAAAVSERSVRARHRPQPRALPASRGAGPRFAARLP